MVGECGVLIRLDIYLAAELDNDPTLVRFEEQHEEDRALFVF